MTVPTYSIAYPVAKHLVDLLQVQLDEVSCFVGWPGDIAAQATREVMWVDDISVETTVPVAMSGRRRRDENVTLTLQFRVAGRETVDEAHVRLDEILGATEDWIAGDPSLDSFEGIVDSQITGHRQTVGVTPNGPVGFGEITVSILSRIH